MKSIQSVLGHLAILLNFTVKAKHTSGINQKILACQR